MKRHRNSVLSVTLAFLMALLCSAQVFAQSKNTYVSEVKVAAGGSAESDLKNEGFTLLCDESGDPVDLNVGAGGGKGSQGNKKVLMGYKTTTKVKDAITDLAVMNMCGGYDVNEYDLLMRRYMGAQISPFIDSFLVAINEYRENIASEDDANRQRAEYIRSALNKFTDDDCGGAGLGDLLLNETVYEMAKPKFDQLSEKEQEKQGIAAVNAEVRNALSEAKKNQHCDILTLFAQADGQIMLVIYDLITRAADTSDDSWIDRFTAMTYDDLLDSFDMAPTDAKKKAARAFDDDANRILQNWETFRALLIGAEEDAVKIDDMELPDIEGAQEKLDALTENASEQEIGDAYRAVDEACAQQAEMLEMAGNIAAADYLASIAYGDGTLYDFFTQSSSEVKENITVLYPMVAALSEGQRAGVEFISLRELVMIGNRESKYSDEQLEDLKEASVYEGVDRGIYRKGGVALTSDVLRSRALQIQKNRADESWLSTKTIVLYAVTGACLLGFIGSLIGFGVRSKQLAKATRIANSPRFNPNSIAFEPGSQALSSRNTVRVDNLSASTATAKWMAVGFSAATFIMAGISAYTTWQDLKDFYKVDYAVIPHYMVDEASITYYNEHGEKLVKENHAAYYEAVTCNRKESDKNYKALSNCADLNGDVGQQWLALYYCKDYNEMQPILANSFKVVVGSSEIPAGYGNRGIHMFGSESAFNLNSKLYDWNQSAKSVFVYFQVDTSAPSDDASTAGSVFTGGMITISAICGAAFGAMVTALAMTAINKRKSKKAAAAA